MFNKLIKKINNKLFKLLWLKSNIGLNIVKIKFLFKYKTTDLNKIMLIKMSNKQWLNLLLIYLKEKNLNIILRF